MADGRRLLILGDDFTGACDAAAGFAAARDVLVVHRVPAAWSSDADVLSVDLDLRERSNGEAEAVTGEAARHLCSACPNADVLLKIDSTLRGPIAGLVAGALTGSGRAVAVLAPAFPEQGRLLREGRVVLDGQLGASLTNLLGMDHTALLGANFARTAEDVELAVEHARTRGARHVIVDADGVEALQSVARAWRRHPEWLLVGSGGLARQIAGGAHQVLLMPTGGPLLVIAGSPTPQTRAQLERLRGLGPIVVVGVATPVPRRPSGVHELIVVCTSPAAERDAGESARSVAETVGAWAADPPPGPAAADGDTGAAAADGDTGQAAVDGDAGAAAADGDAGAAAVDGETAPFRPAAVVLTGGATARAVCERLGALGVRLSGELQPGIPFGQLQGGRWDGVRIVTKAGGFGTPETLLDVVRALGVSSVRGAHP